MTDSTLTPPQEAREAAAACARVIYGERIAVKISAGEMDRHHLVQAFARFEQAIRRDEAEKCARIAEKRAEDRFAECGTRDWDTNAYYYEGAAAETYEALDEEDEAIAAALRARHADTEKIGE